MGAASMGSESIDDIRSSLRPPSVKSMRGGGVRSAIAARLKSGLLLSHRPEARGLLGERYDGLFCARSCAVCARSSARVGKAPEGEERRARGRGRRASAARRTRQSNVYVSSRAGGAILSAAGDPIDLHTTCQTPPTASCIGKPAGAPDGASSTASASARQRMASLCSLRPRRLILSQ
jgi:hypothetical protein